MDFQLLWKSLSPSLERKMSIYLWHYFSSTLQKTTIMAIKMKNNPPSPYQQKSLQHPSPLRIVQYLLFFLFLQLALQVQPLLDTSIYESIYHSYEKFNPLKIYVIINLTYNVSSFNLTKNWSRVKHVYFLFVLNFHFFPISWFFFK